MHLGTLPLQKWIVIDRTQDGPRVVSAHVAQDEAEGERDKRNEGLSKAQYSACICYRAGCPGDVSTMALKRGGIARAEVGPRPDPVLRATLSKWLANLLHPYRPYKYYMRGPGPRTLSKLGEMLRAETEGVTHEPLPQRWLDLIHSVEKQPQIKQPSVSKEASPGACGRD